jgi:hypothetical protein
MATELRYIFFTWPEVVRAIANHRRKTGKRLPHGTVTLKVANRSGDVGVELVVTADLGGETTLDIEERELGAALVMYCIDTAIPLPVAKSSKSIRAFDDTIAMVVARGAPLRDMEELVERVSV